MAVVTDVAALAKLDRLGVVSVSTAGTVAQDADEAFAFHFGQTDREEKLSAVDFGI